MTPMTLLQPRAGRRFLACGTALAAACLALGGGAAQAYVVSISGVRYDVTTFTGDYNNNASRFTTAEMPWWGSSALAQTFATAVDNNVGVAPNFGYAVNGGLVSSWGYRQPPAQPSAGIYNFTSPQGEPNSYAIASLVVERTPAPLPLLGAAAAFRFSRRLRRRRTTASQ
jgi:hypothetical protein